MTKRQRNDTLASSNATLAAGAAKRTARPLLVESTETSDGKLVIFQPHELKKLNVDERYQRIRIGREVNSLIHVLKDGGVIPDPISVAKRPDGTLWILDGQQRFWAHYECERPLQAMVYDVADIRTEMNLFQILNARIKLSGDTLVKSWTGPIGDLIREWCISRPGSPFFAQTNFGQNSQFPYSAGLLARGILASAAGVLSVGAIQNVLARGDFALREAEARARADAYMRLVPLVFPATMRMKFLPAIAIGRVAYARWSVDTTFPSPTIYEKLKKINWDAVAPTHSARYCKLLEDEILKRWK